MFLNFEPILINMSKTQQNNCHENNAYSMFCNFQYIIFENIIDPKTFVMF